MVIYDLICDARHEFEGWFKNVDDFSAQQASGMLCCPFCESAMVSKKVTAAKLTRKSNSTKPASAPKETNAVSASALSGTALNASDKSAAYKKVQKMLSEVHDFVETNVKVVGNRFTDEAISIHRGEKEATNIRGTATSEQLEALKEEGVTAVPLPAKPVDKKKLN